MPKYDPYDSATPEDGVSASDEAEQTANKRRRHEQEAAVRRHIRYQRGQRPEEERSDGGRFSLITNTGAGLVFSIGLSVIGAGTEMIFGDHRTNDVYWGYPFGTAIVAFGALVCGLGIAIWTVVVSFRAIYRGVTG
jgi:hypothetical protein